MRFHFNSRVLLRKNEANQSTRPEKAFWLGGVCPLKDECYRTGNRLGHILIQARIVLCGRIVEASMFRILAETIEFLKRETILRIVV